MSNLQLNEQFIKQNGEVDNTQIDFGGRDDSPTKIDQSRIIVYITDVLDEFENKHRSTAGCLYSIFVSFFFALLALAKSEGQSQMPLLEIIFVSTLIMFIANFQLITNSNILPYIKDDILNSTVKKSAVSLLSSIVLLVASLQNKNPQVSVFFFISGFFLSAIFEKYYHSQTYDPQEILMGLISWGGLAFALSLPQVLLTDVQGISMTGIAYAITGGLSLVYSGETLKQLQHQNIFTITHVIALITIIFLPLFFPIEGLKSPSILDWVFFFVVALGFLIFLPILVRAFSMEKQSLVIHYLGWSVPFYLGMRFIFQGDQPSLLNLIGVVAIIVSSSILLSFQKVRIHSGSFFIAREKDDPNRPKNDAELQLWTSKVPS